MYLMHVAMLMIMVIAGRAENSHMYLAAAAAWSAGHHASCPYVIKKWMIKKRVTHEDPPKELRNLETVSEINRNFFGPPLTLLSRFDLRLNV